MGRSTGSSGHHGLLPAFGFGRNVWATRSPHLRVAKDACDPEEPIAVRLTIIISVGDDFSVREVRSAIAGDRKPGVVLVDVSDLCKPGDDLGSVVSRAVVDEDHLEVGIVDLQTSGQAPRENGGPMLGADHEGDLGRVLQAHRIAVATQGGQFLA